MESKNVLPLNLIALRHRDRLLDQAVRLIRKQILYYPLFLLSSSLFGKELQISRMLVGKFPTSRKNEKNERSKMGQSWAISDER